MTLTRADRLNLLGILALAIGLPAILGVLSGAIDVPHNDDFDYRRVALTLWSSGTLDMRGYSVMALVGQVLFVQPFLWLSGGAPWAFAVATAALAVAGLAGAYLLVRRILDPAPSAIAVLAAVVAPGFLVNTTTFMTDVPAFGATFACLALGSVAIESTGRISWRLLVAALVVGLFGVSIRETVIAAPLAVLVVAGAADSRGPRRIIVAAAVVLAGAAAIHWLAGAIPGQAQPRFDPAAGLLRLRAAYATLALFLGPALIGSIAWWRSRWRVTDVLPGLVIGLILEWGPLVTLARTGQLSVTLIGNLFTRDGPAGSGGLLGARPPIYSAEVWTVVQIAAFVASILLPGVVAGIVGATLRHGGVSRARVRGWSRSPVGLLVVFVVFTAVGLGLYGYAFTMFDRYLWPLVLAGSALLLVRPESVPADIPVDARPSRPDVGRWLAAGLLAGLGVLAVMNLLATNGLLASRWGLAEEAVAMGVPATHIDAGLEWVGFHATVDAVPYSGAPGGQMWYTGWWSSYRQCAAVSSSPLTRPGYVLVLEEPAAYRQFQLVGQELPLYLYSVVGPGCP
jgi:Dolichyl-phosphate-mannose-protein mannosyltransferase